MSMEQNLIEIAAILDPEAFIPRKRPLLSRQEAALEKARAIVEFQQAKAKAKIADESPVTFESLVLDVIRKNLRVELDSGNEPWTDGKYKRIALNLYLGDEKPDNKFTETSTSFDASSY